MDSIGGGLGWGGVGYFGLKTSMYACGTTSCYVNVTFLHACTSTQCYVDAMFLHACTSTQCYVDVTFLHACTKSKVAAAQQIDPCWNHLKKIAPVRWRTALAQPSVLDSGIESFSGSIPTSCLSEIWRPHVSLNFSSSDEEICHWKNDKTWGVLAHGCQKHAVV